MLKEIEEHKSEIRAVCRQFGIRRLDLFGSAVSADAKVRVHDLDFLVDLGDLAPKEYAEAFFALREALENMFSRPVDLVTTSSLRNPFFKQRVEQTKSMLYAA